ncbi:MAG: hypothetical protein LBD51_05630 [Bifidobacteriaceae bacterium]|jgi:hypothetical protein|nr:hypothetical protein [Bifidobacteriaceae bacterium]
MLGRAVLPEGPRGVNARKEDRNAAGWPTDNLVDDFRRRLVVIQVQVKARDGLSVTVGAEAAMRAVLS